MSLIKQRRVLAFKVETTPGTAETLTNTEAVYCTDPVMQADIPMFDRAATGALGRLASVPGARRGKITFNIEVAGDGTDNTPHWATLLTACGFTASSGVYTPTSTFTSMNTVTIGLYEQGIFKLMTGAMGNVSFEAKTGEPLMAKFEFEGIWNAPTDASTLSLPAIPITPPRVAAATLTIGGATPAGVASVSLNMGNAIKLCEDITKVSGYSRAVITDRVVSGKIDPEHQLVATSDVFGSWLAGTEAALNFVVGSATHNTITFAGAKCQYHNVQEGERDGIVTAELDFNLNASSAGSDELTITFS
jgi:hypothetical protein